MKITLPGSGGYLVLLQDGVAQWMLPTFDLPLRVTVSGKPGWESGPTTDGRFHSLDLNTKPSTPTETNKTGGDDKA